MSFLVAFNSDCAAIDVARLKRMSPEVAMNNVQVLGRMQQIVLLGPQTNSALPREDATHRAEYEGRFWFIGRIRLDARDEVLSAISEGLKILYEEVDSLVCLHAYARWSDRCLDHLRGDFCFAIWDEDRQRLFCGRDQLGVRPLFYAKERNSWLVSDCLELIAANTALSLDFDDYWIVDFLTSGFSIDLDRTGYKQVKRLPPAHYVSISAHSAVVQRYWTLEKFRSQYIMHSGGTTSNTSKRSFRWQLRTDSPKTESGFL